MEMQMQDTSSKQTETMVELDLNDAEMASGGSLLLGYAIGMLIDHYLIKPLWNN